MSYLNIINTIFTVITTLLALCTVHFAAFAVVGVFYRKKFPESKEKLRYGAIIPARNEELVVADLIHSIQNSNYPNDRLEIFVIAHNCTDRTAEIAREAGAVVYEYNNPNECTMGYAFRYLFDRIREDYGIENFDGFFLFNADNVVDPAFFDKMNDAFIANGRDTVITSYRNSKNFGSSVMSALYGLYFINGCRLESCGRTALNFSTRVQGTGYVIPAEIVKNGWQYVTLTEDWEFTSDQLLRDRPIVYCDEAIFYDEQPNDCKIMWRQRVRWARGHLLVCMTRWNDLAKALFSPKSKTGQKKVHKFCLYDMMVNISPICVTSFFLFVAQLLLTVIAPLFGAPILSTYLGYLVGLLKGAAVSCGSLALSAILIYFLERKRIPHVPLARKILSVIVWPFFLLLSILCEVAAVFSPNLEWKPIPHREKARSELLLKK